MLFERRIRVKVKFNMKMPIFHVLSSDYDECSSFFIAKAGKKFAFPKWNVINLYRRRCLNCVHCSIASKMHLWGDFYLYKTDHFFLTHRNAFVQFQMMRFFFKQGKSQCTEKSNLRFGKKESNWSLGCAVHWVRMEREHLSGTVFDILCLVLSMINYCAIFTCCQCSKCESCYVMPGIFGYFS